MHNMTRFSDLERDEPAFAARVRDRLDARVHKTLATLRRNGDPRISGTETRWHDGDLWLGSMPGALKARDLQRDGRFALHTGSDDPPAWTGDAKLSGLAIEETEDETIRSAVLAGTPDSDAHVFRLDLREVSIVELDEAGKQLVITIWKQGEALRTMRRS